MLLNDLGAGDSKSYRMKDLLYLFLEKILLLSSTMGDIGRLRVNFKLFGRILVRNEILQLYSFILQILQHAINSEVLVVII